MRDSKKEARLRGVDAGAPARRDPPPATERGHSIPVRTLGADGIRLGLVLLLLLLLLRVRELVGDLVASAAGLSLLRRHGCLTTLFASKPHSDDTQKASGHQGVVLGALWAALGPKEGYPKTE